MAMSSLGIKHLSEERHDAVLPNVVIHDVSNEARLLEQCAIRALVTVQFYYTLNRFVKTFVIHTVDETLRIEVSSYQRIAPVDRNGTRQQRLETLLRRETWNRTTLKGKHELEAFDVFTLLAHSSGVSNVVQMSAGRMNLLIFAETAEEIFTRRLIVWIGLPKQDATELAVPQRVRPRLWLRQ